MKGRFINVSTKNHVQPKYFICMFLVVITLLAYWQLPSHNFVNFDDNGYITENPKVHKGVTRESIEWAFGVTDFAYWHPLTWLSHMLAFQLFGLNSGMHHLVNLFFHIANTVLLFFLLNRMTGSILQSGFVAAMFALHPLNVESVAWASERKNVLSTLFWMLTLLSYIHYVKRRTVLKYLLILFVFTLGLMAKPMLVTLPLVLLLLDYWPLRRFNCAMSKNTGYQKLPFLHLVLEKMPLLILSLISIYLSSISLQKSGFIVSTASVPMKLRIANALVSYVNYIKKMIWPHNLAVYYPFPYTIPLWHVVGAGFLILGISLMVFKTVKTRPYLIVGWLWYMGTLVPVIGLMQAGLWPAMADRFAYVPLIGLFMIVAWGVPDLIRWRYKKIMLATLATILISNLTVMTWLQIRYWQDGVSLFTHNLNVTRNNSVAHNNLGYILMQHGDYKNAIDHYNNALRINPNYVEAHNNLGTALLQQGDYKKAIYHYYKALRINPNYAETHNNLGTALLQQGDYKKAIYHYYEALNSNPKYAGAYYNLGKIFLNQGKTEEAINLYRKALKFSPEMIQALYNLSWLIATHEDKKVRNGNEAVKLAEKLCSITHYTEPLALDALAAAFAETKRFDAAVLTAKKALNIALRKGPKELVSGLEERLKLYQTEQPYRQNSLRKNES
jgi:protein O-mannosyl-transferase